MPFCPAIHPLVQRLREIMASKKLPEFVLFGDSLTEWSFSESTQGFGRFLETQYEGRARVVNEGQAGYTSTKLKSDFDRIITRATTPGGSPTLLFTIFVGANDACFIGPKNFVPYDEYIANIRAFIETILTQDAMPSTKIVLITPPPINGPEPELDSTMTQADIADANAYKKEGVRHRTYMSKKRYADGVMGLAAEYEETGRVAGINFWQDLVEAGARENGDVFDEQMPPGCGLIGSKAFGKGWFTDGLHLNVKGYNVLTKALEKILTERWPELAPERL